MRTEIMAYYRLLGERERLGTGAGRLEFLRTWDILTRTLPVPPARVLDVGGATGVYARPLAEAGYAVHLVDPVPEHVAHAAAIQGVTAAQGDARQLAEGERTYDAVLLFGPLYHLLERADRVRAWAEAGRVVRPGGVVLAAMITRFASLFDGLANGYLDHPMFRDIVDACLETGVHRPPDPDRRFFTTAYFHRPEEIPAEVAAAGLMLDRIVIVEGPVGRLGQLDEILADADRARVLLTYLRAVEAEPSLLGASSHLLTVARRG